MSKKYSTIPSQVITDATKIFSEFNSILDKFAYFDASEIITYISSKNYLTETEIEALSTLLKTSDITANNSVVAKDGAGAITSIPIADLETAYPKLLYKGFDIEVTTSLLTIEEGRYYNEILFETDFTKTFDAFVLGEGNGCLDTSAGLVDNSKYNVFLIQNGTNFDIYATVGTTMPAGWTEIKQIGIFWVGVSTISKKTIFTELDIIGNSDIKLPPNYISNYALELDSVLENTINVTDCFAIDSTNSYNMYLFGLKKNTQGGLVASTSYNIFLTSNKGNNIDIEVEKTADGTTLLTNPHFRKIGAFVTDASGDILEINLINLSNNFSQAVIGDFDAGNYTHIYPDGTIRYRGNATVWDDITGSLVARRLESTAGKVNYEYAENAIVMQSGGVITNNIDRLIFNFSKHHKVKKISSIFCLIRFEQVNTNKIEFTLQYRLQKNGGAKTTAWTTIMTNSDDDAVFPYVSGTLNQIVKLGSVDWSEAFISSTVQFRLARTDSTGGDILATFVDAHVEFDADGSEEPYVKIIP